MDDDGSQGVVSAIDQLCEKLLTALNEVKSSIDGTQEEMRRLAGNFEDMFREVYPEKRPLIPDGQGVAKFARDRNRAPAPHKKS